MMLTFQDLLLLIPGFIRSYCGVIKFPIGALNCVGTIMLPKLIEDHFEVGHWAQVLTRVTLALWIVYIHGASASFYSPACHQLESIAI